MFAFGRRLAGNRGVERPGTTLLVAAIVGALQIFELVVAVYGWLFQGGGVSACVNLPAMLCSRVGMTNIHAMNALKTILGIAINGVATLVFVAKGAIYWPQAAAMTVGALLGGYSQTRTTRRELPQAWIRGFVILVGLG